MRENRRVTFEFNTWYFISFILLFAIEVLNAKYMKDGFVRPFVGDVLVVWLLYFGVKSFVKVKNGLLPFGIFVFAGLVELTQLLGLVELLGLENNSLEKTVLGSTFDWHDVLAYGIGCFLIWLWDSRRIELAFGLVVSNLITILVVINFILREADAHVMVISLCMVAIVLVGAAMFVSLHIIGDFRVKGPTRRLKVLFGGRKLMLVGLVTVVVNTLLVVLLRDMLEGLFGTGHGLMTWVSLSSNYVIGLLISGTFYTNGIIRILLLSHRVGVELKILAVIMMYVPVVNLLVVYVLDKRSYQEYDHECNKINMDKVRVVSQVCDTRYPLLMLHGVGFKDYKYVNYWGRIPKELIKNGAKVYYGHQEAWGTIEDNGAEVKEKIFEILRKEQCDKVNIIAHSKGGLDGRYVVSQLGMAPYVASLTMIGTPHEGSEVLEFVEKLPKKLVAFIGNMINRHFRMLGDKNPNFHVAYKQFLINNSKAFNERTPDSEGVYYQSYATKMKTPFSDFLLMVPYMIVRIMGSENDGLVTVSSSKWGDFRGVVTADYHRGISHGDIIDLKREDYAGFDVREFYVGLVGELKGMGY